MNSPAEILQIWIGNGVKKANLPVFKMVLLGMAAGVYIGFGAHVFLLATAAAETVFEAGIAKLVGAALFPVGLILTRIIWRCWKGSRSSRKGCWPRARRRSTRRTSFRRSSWSRSRRWACSG